MNIRGENGESIRLERVIPPPSGDDHLVRVTVDLGDYRGAVEAWVHSDAWSGFCRQLVALEESRRASAVLESTSPGELRLEILATDSLGHMGVRGRLHRAGLAPAPLLEFGIVSFEPHELVGLVRDLRLEEP